MIDVRQGMFLISKTFNDLLKAHSWQTIRNEMESYPELKDCFAKLLTMQPQDGRCWQVRNTGTVYVNIRADHNVQARILGKLKPGEVLPSNFQEFHDSRGQRWRQVIYKNMLAYIPDFISGVRHEEYPCGTPIQLPPPPPVTYGSM